MLAGLRAETRTNCRDGWSSRSERCGPASSLSIRPRSSIRSRTLSPPGSSRSASRNLTVALKQEAKQPNSLIAGELNRRREPLEAYPLDNMHMVGSVAREGRQFALLKIDALLYQVKVGDYIGQNYGRITKISETSRSLSGRSFRMLQASGSNAMAASSFRRRRNENGA